MDHREGQPSEGRTKQDRRRHRMPSLRMMLLHPRRSAVRRAADRSRIVLLDQYNASMLLPVLLVLVLSVTDAVLTLFLLNHGAVEINPLMAYFIGKGPLVFLIAKYVLTAIAVMIMVLLNYRSVPFLKMDMRDLLKVCAGVFAAVIVWQLFIVYRYVL
jgi:Domain of unknown function (DUF5658)